MPSHRDHLLFNPVPATVNKYATYLLMFWIEAEAIATGPQLLQNRSGKVSLDRYSYDKLFSPERFPDAAIPDRRPVTSHALYL